MILETFIDRGLSDGSGGLKSAVGTDGQKLNATGYYQFSALTWMQSTMTQRLA
jgi:hypothetical protein